MASDYDADFSRYLAVAKKLVVEIHDKADRQICTKWIQKLCNLNSDDSSVKRNRNAFFKYLLQIMQEQVTRDPAKLAVTSLCPSDKNKEASGSQPESKSKDDSVKFLCHWSPDRKTYVACKPIPGRGALVYMAVADDLELGWDLPGNKWKKPEE